MGMAIMAIDTMAIAPTMPMSVILQATLLNPAMALLLPVMGLLLQGYYNTGWFKEDLSACWSCIRYPKRISQT